MKNESYSTAIWARCKGQGARTSAEEKVLRAETGLRSYSRDITKRQLCRSDVHFFKSNLRAAASSLRLTAST
jgi:hypothetical protein